MDAIFLSLHPFLSQKIYGLTVQYQGLAEHPQSTITSEWKASSTWVLEFPSMSYESHKN